MGGMHGSWFGGFFSEKEKLRSWDGRMDVGIRKDWGESG